MIETNQSFIGKNMGFDFCHPILRIKSATGLKTFRNPVQMKQRTVEHETRNHRKPTTYDPKTFKKGTKTTEVNGKAGNFT